MPEGVRAELYDRLDSTNTKARMLAQAGEKGPLWVIAKHQTMGRGRLGRTWVSDAGGNLYASLLFAPKVAARDLSALSFITALAVGDALVAHGVAAEDIACKWPNDVLIGDKKCSGILIESLLGAEGHLDAVVVGVGVNLVAFPAETRFPATSVQDEIGHTPSVEDFLASLAHAFVDQWQHWENFGFGAVAKRWLPLAWNMNKRCKVDMADGFVEGIFVRLGDDGGMVIKLDDGTEKSLYAGDVYPIDV